MMSETRSIWILISLIIFYPLVSIFQGLDITDTGFSVAHYALFFEHFDAISSSSAVWLTTLLGASWENIVGVHIGLISHKLLFVLFTYINTFIAYQLLRKHFRTDYILIGLFLAITYQCMSQNVFSYNTATSSFVASSPAFATVFGIS